MLGVGIQTGAFDMQYKLMDYHVQRGNEVLKMAKLDFSIINRASAKSFNEQRDLIKKIGQGAKVLCAICRQPLKLSVSSAGEHGVSCENSCTRISLELAE